VADAVDLGTAAGQGSVETNRRFYEAFDRITRQIAAVLSCNSSNAIV
jgi:hypothetical protein